MKCFSCRLSLRKSQETTFSNTEWGTWAEDVSFTLGHVIQFFFFSCRTVQQVFPPSLPLANSCLKFKEVYQPLGIFFSCRWLRFCYRCDGDRNVNKMLLHCRMVDEWHSVCEKYTVVMKWNSPLKIFWKIFKCCDMLNTHPNSLNRVYCSIWWKTLAEKKM